MSVRIADTQSRGRDCATRPRGTSFLIAPLVPGGSRPDETRQQRQSVRSSTPVADFKQCTSHDAQETSSLFFDPRRPCLHLFSARPECAARSDDRPRFDRGYFGQRPPSGEEGKDSPGRSLSPSGGPVAVSCAVYTYATVCTKYGVYTHECSSLYMFQLACNYHPRLKRSI